MTFKIFLYLSISLLPFSAIAQVDVFFDNVTHTAGFTGLDSIPQKGDNCSLNQGIMSVIGNQYSKSGRYIELIKVQRKDGEIFALPTNFEKLNNPELTASQELAKTGGIVFLRFSTCGSGGYLSLIDILKPL
ncbi:hypothetical protein [Pantoea sp. BAV 3049]|uniref:hypothetical protein n=1 Tax=Pantoea sp. BAV 3049 TaxID=2654188 RepID=UPI00131ACAF1|nr:hypothetical protein [Pantoea sp. BAV 3049]